MKLGFALCGSFCNHAAVLKIYEQLSEVHELIPILSERSATPVPWTAHSAGALFRS